MTEGDSWWFVLNNKRCVSGIGGSDRDCIGQRTDHVKAEKKFKVTLDLLKRSSTCRSSCRLSVDRRDRGLIRSMKYNDFMLHGIVR